MAQPTTEWPPIPLRLEESAVVMALKDTWAQTVNVSVTGGFATDVSGTASADSG
jgi:hypothetical protein